MKAIGWLGLFVVGPVAVLLVLRWLSARIGRSAGDPAWDQAYAERGGHVRRWTAPDEAIMERAGNSRLAAVEAGNARLQESSRLSRRLRARRTMRVVPR